MAPKGKYPAHGMRLQMRQITHQAEKINSFEMVNPDGEDLPEFTAGAHIDFFFRDGSVRQYSLCNDPKERHRYVIAILRDDKGRGGSLALHERLHVQRTVSIGKPRNNFPVHEEAKHHLLLAGGIGVTPMMSMIHHFQSTGAEYTLHYCTRSKEHTAFQYEFADLITEGRVIIHHDDGIPGNGLDLKTLLKDHSSGTHLYYCGPPGFMRAVKGFSAHWPDDTVHLEYFTAAASPKTTMSDEEKSHAGDEALGIGFQVKIASSGAIFSVPNHKSIVQVLGENGIDIEVSCQSGLCRTCAVKYLEGEVDHKDLVLSESDRLQYMTPCCSRAKSKLIVLDL
jgi:vanillate O-demethylase ferredoxin subunit